MESRLFLSVSMVDGWTVVTPSTDSRTVYVSNSAGNNNNTGLSQSAPVKTIEKGVSLLRNGFPDQLLLKRGDVWYEGLGVQSWSKNGRNENEPMLISAYGTGARPLLKTGTRAALAVNGSSSPSVLQHLSIIGLSFYAHTRDPDGGEFTGTDGSGGVEWINGANDILFEDCYFDSYETGLGTQEDRGQQLYNFRLRRNVIVDSYAVGAHSQGIYMSGVHGLLVEENIFDHCGWNEQIAGAQSTIYNHAMYIQYSSSDVTVRGNIVNEPSSNGLQARGGGTVENNFFLDNPIGFFTASGTSTEYVSSILRDNVVLGATTINGDPRGWAIEGMSHENLIENNIAAHSNAPPSNSRAYRISAAAVGTNPSGELFDNPKQVETFRGNIAYDWPTLHLTISDSNMSKLDVHDNIFQEPSDGSQLVSINRSPTTATDHFANNRYYTNRGSTDWFSISFAGKTYAQWVAAASETGSTNTSLSFVDPNRSVETYMASLGRTATKAAYLAALRNQSRSNWDLALTADAINDYIRAGFAIVGAPANAVPAVAANTGVNLQAGRGIVLTTSRLSVTDADGPNDQILYLVEELPSHGSVRLNGAALVKRQTFTQADLIAGRVRYEHNGDSAVGDRFVFRATDGKGGITASTSFNVTFGSTSASGAYVVSNSAPVIAPGQSFHVSETAPNGTLLGRLQITDADVGQHFNYEIIGYNYHDPLRIDRHDGDFTSQIMTNGATIPFNSATQPVITLTVKVTDDGANPLSDTETIIIYVDGNSSSTPAAPTALGASAVSTSQINLTWTDNSSNETGFELDRATNSSFTQNLLSRNLSANVTSFNDTGLTANTAYYYRVRSTNAAGDSANSNTASATTATAGPLTAGESFAYTPGSAISTWNGGTGWAAGSAWGTDGGFATSSIVSSSLSFTPAGGTTISDGSTALQVIGSTGGAGSYGDDRALFRALATPQNSADVYVSFLVKVPAGQSLANGEAATFWFGSSTSSSFGSSSPNIGLRPYGTSTDPFVARFGTSTGTGRVTSNGGGYSENTTYMVIAKLSKSVPGTSSSYDRLALWVNPSAAQSTTIGTGGYVGQAQLTGTGLTNVGALLLRTDNNNTVQFDRIVLGAAWSDVLPAAPSAPSGLSATPVSPSQINLSWTDNASNETGFKIDRATDAAFTQNLVPQTVGTNVTTFNDTDLASATTYYYRVRATNAAGDSANSSTTSAMTQAMGFANESFNYPAGAAISTWTRGAGWASGAWTTAGGLANPQIVSNALSYTPSGGNVISDGTTALQVTGSTAGNGTNSVDKALSRALATPQNSADVYASFLVKVPAGQSLSNNEVATFWFGSSTSAAFGPSSPNIGLRPYGTSTDPFVARFGTSTGTGRVTSNGGGYSENTTYMVIAKLSKSVPGTSSSYDRLALWVNPSDTQSTTVGVGGYAGEASLGGGGLTSIGAVFLRIDNNNTVLLDRVVLGNTWTDMGTQQGDAGMMMMSVNDGSTQRSMVKTVDLKFEQPVTFQSGALSLGWSKGGNLAVQASNPSNDRRNYVLTFSGNGYISGAGLEDGEFTLGVDRALVRTASNAPLGTGVMTYKFHRLLGDADGDRDVDATDSRAFRSALDCVIGQASYRSWFDFDGDGDIDATDSRSFRLRLDSLI